MPLDSVGSYSEAQPKLDLSSYLNAWAKACSPVSGLGLKHTQEWNSLGADLAREAQDLATGSARCVQSLADLNMATATKAMSVTQPAQLAELSSRWAAQSFNLMAAEAENRRQSLTRMMNAVWTSFTPA